MSQLFWFYRDKITRSWLMWIYHSANRNKITISNLHLCQISCEKISISVIYHFNFLLTNWIKHISNTRIRVDTYKLSVMKVHGTFYWFPLINCLITFICNLQILSIMRTLFSAEIFPFNFVFTVSALFMITMTSNLAQITLHCVCHSLFSCNYLAFSHNTCIFKWYITVSKAILSTRNIIYRYFTKL